MLAVYIDRQTAAKEVCYFH